MCQHCQSSSKENQSNKSCKCTASKVVRRKIWEIDSSACCPIVGNCFSISELRKIGRQNGSELPDDYSDYDVHRYFVQAAQIQTPLSQRLNKALERKYAGVLKTFSACQDAEAVQQCWDKHVKRGEMVSAFWALMTHPVASVTLLDRAMGEVHMLSHEMSRTNHASIRQLQSQSTQIKQMELKLEKERKRFDRRLETKGQEVEKLQQQLKDLEQRIQQSVQQTQQTEKNQKHQKNSGAEPIKVGRVVANQKNADPLESRLEHVVQLLQERTERMSTLQSELWEQKRLVKQLNVQLQQRSQSAQTGVQSSVQSNAVQAKDRCADCSGEELDLCGRCVLYVGGQAKMKPHYREIVQKKQGNFLYHDGGREDAFARLQGDVQRADTIVCPVNCVSHAAVCQLKTLCKKHNKPLVFLRNDGVSSFENGLKPLQLAQEN